VEVQAGDRTIILDAGTGIIPLGREMMKRSTRENRTPELLLLFSHLHHDHTQGFPFFIPAYMPNARLHIFGPGGTNETVRHVLEHNQSAETFPISLHDMASGKDIQSVHESRVIHLDKDGIHVREKDAAQSEDAIVIHIHRSYAHPGGVHIYRITWLGRSVVYATDTEGYVGTDRRLVEFARNADVLIHDAQYSELHYRGALAGFPSTQGYGHSTAEMACEVAASAEVKKLILFHHDPAYVDSWVAAQESKARKIFPNSHAAHEGMEIDLSQTPEPSKEDGEGMELQYVENG
jgi:ribonuclease BN (tRNA processing enzyme)